MTDTE